MTEQEKFASDLECFANDVAKLQVRADLLSQKAAVTRLSYSRLAFTDLSGVADILRGCTRIVDHISSTGADR